MKKALGFAILLVVVLALPCFAADLSISQQYPVRGEKLRVTVTGADNPESIVLHATYRPNSSTELKTVVGPLGADGTVLWKPVDAGITTLLAMGGDKKIASKNVAVCYPSTPASGMVVMFLAGFLLFGGALYSLRNALKEKL